MDNLLDAFNSLVNVSFDSLDTYTKHPRLDQFKEKTNKNSQEERRKTFLELQKQKKVISLNLKRGLKEKHEAEKIEKELMEVTASKPKKAREFKDVLMLSEWLMDIPNDFLDKWIVVPCPIGKRVLLVAEKGTTVAYARKGFKVLHKFPSSLPGGSYNGERKAGYTRLDCIWSEVDQTLYVVDALDFGPSLVDCECQFRFSWLNWKCTEYSDIREVSKCNKFKIIPLERFKANHLDEFVKKPFNSDVKMDGFMFFHEEGLYEEYGRSPLVTWLKPYMISDIFNIETHPDYSQDKPLQMETEVSLDNNKDNSQNLT